MDKRIVLSGQSREIVFNVFNYFNDNSLPEEKLQDIKLKTSQATRVSVRTIERIIREGEFLNYNKG